MQANELADELTYWQELQQLEEAAENKESATSTLTQQTSPEAQPQLTTPPATKKFNLAIPHSHCPQCKTAVSWYDNIPLLSYLLLRGRCRHCQASISARYPLIELLMALATVVLFWQFGLTWQAGALSVLSALLITLAAIDIDTLQLPDKLTLPGLWLGLACSVMGWTVSPTQAIIGAIAGYGVLWLFFWLYQLSTGKQGIGYGDFKLLALLGAWFGWEALPIIVIVAAGTGSIYGASQILTQRANRETPFFFGPFLAFAGWLWAVVGSHIDNPLTTNIGLY